MKYIHIPHKQLTGYVSVLEKAAQIGRRQIGLQAEQRTRAIETVLSFEEAALGVLASALFPFTAFGALWGFVAGRFVHGLDSLSKRNPKGALANWIPWVKKGVGGSLAVAGLWTLASGIWHVVDLGLMGGAASLTLNTALAAFGGTAGIITMVSSLVATTTYGLFFLNAPSFKNESWQRHGAQTVDKAGLSILFRPIRPRPSRTNAISLPEIQLPRSFRWFWQKSPCKAQSLTLWALNE